MSLYLGRNGSRPEGLFDILSCGGCNLFQRTSFPFLQFISQGCALTVGLSGNMRAVSMALFGDRVHIDIPEPGILQVKLDGLYVVVSMRSSL